MLRFFRRISQENKGQSMVELALVLPLVLLLLMGVVEFGRMFHTYLVLTQGSREGARLAVVGESDTAVTNRVERVASSLDVTKIRIQISPPEKERVRGIPVAVILSYNLELLLPNLFDLFPDPIVISSTTTMRME